MPATLNEIKHKAQIKFSVVHWKEGNEKRRTFGRSNEAENVFRRAWLNTTSHGRTRGIIENTLRVGTHPVATQPPSPKGKALGWTSSTKIIKN